MKDLEEMQRHLEMHLENEIKAREAEADSRLKQEKYVGCSSICNVYKHLGCHLSSILN